MFGSLHACTARRLVPLAVFGVVTTAGTAAAEPANDACPNGFETITVAQAEAEGYFPVPVIVDTSFGNGDGVVCRRALGDGVLRSFPEPPTVDQIYFWLDNSTPR